MMAPFNIRWLQWPLSHSSLWLPIASLALDRYVTRPTGRRWVVAALGAAVLQLAGHPETQFQAGVVAGLVVLARLFATPLPPRPALGRVAGCLGAMTAGALLAAPQLLPFLVQVPTSADWIEKFHASPGGLSPSGLWLLLGHDFYGRPRAGNAYVGPANYIEAGCGIGLVATGLALAGLIKALRPGNDPAKRFALACAIGWSFFLAILFALPGVSDAVMRLPLFDQANRHRWILAIDFFGAALAAFGLHFALAEGRRALLAAGLVLAATITLGIAIEKAKIPSPELKDGGPVWWHHSPARYSKLKDALEQPHWRTIVHHPAVTTAISLAIGVLAGLSLLRRQDRGRAIGALLVIEAFAGAWDFNATAPAALADPPAPPLLQRAIGIAGADRMTATNEVLYPNLSVRYDFRDVAGYDWPLPMRLTTALRKLDWRVVEGTSLPRRMAAPVIDPRLAAFLSRAAVRAIYTDLRLDELRAEFHPWKQVADGPVADAIYLNPQPMSRARVPFKTALGDETIALESLLATDLNHPTVLEGDVDPSFLNTTYGVAGEATVTEDLPERVTIKARLDKPGVVVLADRMAPGWSVTVDGKPATALTADYLFRAVAAPMGEHEVTWTYRAPGFAAGLVLAALTAAGIALLLLRRTPPAGRSGSASDGGVTASAPPAAARPAAP
jgi:hypothetical protein